MLEGCWRSNTELVEEIYHRHLLHHKYDVEYELEFSYERPAVKRMNQSTVLLHGQAE